MTEDDNATVDKKTTPLGGASGNVIGSRTNEKRVLGKVEDLGELIYKFNTKDQADMYLCTTEAIADYVGVKYGKNMRMLVKHGKEKSFTEPKPPRKDDSTPALLEKYKSELTIFHRESKEYKEQKAKIFVIILGQTSRSVKSKLENDTQFIDLEERDDVTGLLAKLKEMAFSTGGVQNPFWTLQGVLKRLAVINQGRTESVANYHKQFLAITDVIEAQWGQFCPIGLAESTSREDKTAAHDKFLSMIFLAGADKVRYGKLLEDLNNSFLSKKDNYPSNIDSTLTLLSHYQDHQAIRTVDDKGNVTLGTSLMQHNKKNIRCYKCNEYGHVQKNCPKKIQCIQRDDDDGSKTDDFRKVGWCG